MLKTAEKSFRARGLGKKAGNKNRLRLPRIRVAGEFYLVHLPGAVQTQILAGCHAITRKHHDWIKLGLTNSLYGGAFQFAAGDEYPRRQKATRTVLEAAVSALRQHGYFSVSAGGCAMDVVCPRSLTEIFYEMDKLRSVLVPET